MPNSKSFCESCLMLLDDERLIDTDLVPSDLYGFKSVEAECDVAICQLCFDKVFREGITSLLELRNKCGTVGIALIPSGKRLQPKKDIWYLRAYCGAS